VQETKLGQVIILNGAPRAGKSSIITVIQNTFEGPWMNLGVDICVRHITPVRYQPGIGLRPGGERPELEPFIPIFYAALYESVAAHSRQGLNIVMDVGHHDAHSVRQGVLADCARRLVGYPVLFVGVRCPLPAIMERRRTGQPGRLRT
jgi:chloramphenicol 3-O phosphotransferase